MLSIFCTFPWFNIYPTSTERIWGAQVFHVLPKAPASSQIIPDPQYEGGIEAIKKVLESIRMLPGGMDPYPPPPLAESDTTLQG
jgi:hypothetical protein